MLCGATPNCNCTMSTVAATAGSITGSLPTITVAGTGLPATPWTMTLDTAWATKVANAVGPTPWTAVTFVNSWDNYSTATADTGWERASYRKIGDMVYLRGLIRHPGAGDGTTAFVLPAGFCPPAVLMCSADLAYPRHGRVDIYADGQVQPRYVAPGSGAYYSLSNVKFSVTA